MRLPSYKFFQSQQSRLRSLKSSAQNQQQMGFQAKFWKLEFKVLREESTRMSLEIT